MSDTNKLYDSLRDQLNDLNLDNIDFSSYKEGSTTNIAESQKIFFWIRVYISNEIENLESGDDINIKYLPKNESLTVKFIYYGKKGIDRDLGETVINYNSEDDKKVLCLMVDSSLINNNDDIKFMRTLFKQGNHYEYQLLKRSDLELTLIKDMSNINYYDIDF